MTGLTVVIAIILLASNFTIINAQQQQQEFTSQPGEVENRRAAAGTATTAAGRTFQSTNDSFSVQVPDGWIIHDVDSAGFTSLEESRQGYVMLAQLCPEEEQQRILSNADSSTNSSSTSTSNGCQGAQEVIHIIRYPDLRTRLSTNNVTTTNNNMTTTTDNILSYHLQKLQEVGYRDIEIVNSIERTVNLTNAQTNQTIQTVPAKFVEMTYATVSAPNETREGYFILTATNATAPNPGMTKGYSIFYEGGSSVAATAKNTAEITTASGSLIPSLSPPVGQVLDSFELIAAPEATQAVVQTGQGGGVGQAVQSECDASYPDVCIPSPPPELNCDDEGVPENFEVSGSDPHGFDGDNDGIGCESGNDAPDDDSDDVEDDDDNGADDDDNPEDGSEEGQPLGGVLPRTPPTPEGGVLAPPETGEEGQPLGGLPPAPPSNDNGEGVSPTPEEEEGGESPPETGEEGGQGSEEGGQGSEEGLPPAPPSNDNGEGVSPTPEGGQGSENEFEDCVVPPGMDPGDVGC
jgi:hypothetical protein